MHTRREFLSAAALAVVPAAPRDLPLLDDTRFKRGCIVWEPAPGKKVKAGALRPFAGTADPVWGLAQWHSRFNLAGAKPERLPTGAVKFFDGAKTVVFGPAGGPDADVTLGVDGFAERGGRAPQPGDAWPHLLLERPLLNQRPISEFEAVRFQFAYRLRQAEAVPVEGYDPHKQTAQFQLYLTVQNGNRESRGFHDYYWFGVHMYDARYRFPPQYGAKDFGTPKKPGTGKFIYCSDFHRFSAKSAQDGDWIAIETDLLPMIRQGLEAAWKSGYLLDSHNLADYHLGTTNIGWEVTGTWRVAVQVRGLSLKGALKI